MILTTQRLRLREPRQNDLDPMFAIYSDPVVMRYWSTPPHENRDVTQGVLDRRLDQWAKAPANFQITIDDHYIGQAGGGVDTNEIGFMLNQNYWRQGILTEAMDVIIPHLWQITNHDQLTADADPENTASCGLLRSLGFRETHRAKNTFCINDVWSDSIYFALPRPG